MGNGCQARRVHEETDGILGVQTTFPERTARGLLVCLTGQDDAEEGRCGLENYGDQLRQAALQLQPIDVGLLAG